MLAYRLGSLVQRPRAVDPARARSGWSQRFLSFIVRNVYGIELYPTARIGRRFCIAHQHGIVIHKLAMIGDDCLVRQGVTIGAGGIRDDAARPPRTRRPGEDGRGRRDRGPDQHRRRRDDRPERSGDDQRPRGQHRHRAALAHHDAAAAPRDPAEPTPIRSRRGRR